MIAIRDIMVRSVVTVPSSAPVAEVARVLADRDIGGAPVCDTSGHVLGIVSKTDVVEAMLSMKDGGGAQPVQAVMYPEVFSVCPDASIDEAIRTMAFEGVHRLVVFDEAGHLAGIVTTMDVLRALAGIPRASERIIAVAPPA